MIQSRSPSSDGDQKTGDKNIASCRMMGIEAEMSRYLALSGPSQSPNAKPFIAAKVMASGMVMRQMRRGDVLKMKANGIRTTAL